MSLTADAGNSGKQPLNWLPLALLAAIIGLVPMIVYMRVVVYEGIASEVYGKTTDGNFFSYYKAVWLCILSGSAMLWFMVNGRLQNSWYQRPLVAYSFFTIVSTIFARHWQLALWGDPHRHEGLLVHLSYMAVVCLFINLIEDRRGLKVLVAALLMSATVLAVVGLLQFMGFDYIYSSFAPRLFVSKELRELIPDLDLKKMQNGLHSIYLTFGNGNFTGSYMTMLFALTLPLALTSTRKLRLLLVPLNLLLFINLLGSKSRAGLLGGLIGLAVAALFLRRNLRSEWRTAALLAFCYLLAPYALDAYTWKQDLPRYLNTSVARSVVFGGGMFGNFQDLKIEKERVTFVFDGLSSEVRAKDGRLDFYDHKGELVPYRLLPNPEKRTDQYQTSSLTEAVTAQRFFSTADLDPREGVTASGNLDAGVVASSAASGLFFPSKEYLVVFPGKRMLGFIIYAWPEQNVIEIGRGGVSFRIVYTGSGFKLLNQFYRPIVLKEIETLGFKGLEGFASNRGYIWSRTLPLLKDCLWLGYGPDTFAAHFPNHDYIGKLKVWPSGIFTMIEKPHSFYLQIAINSGIICLVFILTLFAGYLLESVQLYWRTGFDSFSAGAGLGIFSAVFAYLVTAVFNDSVVSVAPVFWALLGMGIAANRLNRENTTD